MCNVENDFGWKSVDFGVYLRETEENEKTCGRSDKFKRRLYTRITELIDEIFEIMNLFARKIESPATKS